MENILLNTAFLTILYQIYYVFQDKLRELWKQAYFVILRYYIDFYHFETKLNLNSSILFSINVDLVSKILKEKIYDSKLWSGKVKNYFACYILDSIKPLIMALMQDCFA